MSLYTNLVSYWKLDESSGNAADSVGSNTGTNVRGVTYGAGKINNCAIMDIDSALTLGSSTSLISDTQTWNFWLVTKPTDTSTIRTFIARNQTGDTYPQFGFIIFTDDKLYITTDNNAGTGEQRQIGTLTTANLEDGDMLTLVVNYPTVTLYINGVSAGTTASFTQHFTQNVGTNETAIGQNGLRDANHADGMKIDEIGLWSRVLSTDEISQIFNSGRGNAYPLTDTPALYGDTAYYKLDESSGNAIDSIGNNTLTNTSTTYAASKINNGAVFNGSSSKLIAGATVIPIGAKTIAFWIKSSYTAAYQCPITNCNIFNPSYGTGCYLDLSGHPNFTCRNNNVSDTKAWDINTNTNVCDGNWHQIVLTWDGTTSANTVKLYVDAVLKTSVTASATETNTPSSNLTLGVNSTGSDTYFNGSLDEISIWTRALDVSEIKKLYNFGNGLQYSFINQNNFLIFL